MGKIKYSVQYGFDYSDHWQGESLWKIINWIQNYLTFNFLVLYQKIFTLMSWHKFLLTDHNLVLLFCSYVCYFIWSDIHTFHCFIQSAFQGQHILCFLFLVPPYTLPPLTVYHFWTENLELVIKFIPVDTVKCTQVSYLSISILLTFLCKESFEILCCNLHLVTHQQRY
jgi:hypothetical protein